MIALFRPTALRVSGLTAFRHVATFTSTNKPSEYKVLLDNETLYVGKELAAALGWTETTGAESVKLSLHGLKPTFFTITPTGSESEELARKTIESNLDQNVKGVLEYLKDR